jgi:mutual gliding-motility protein MglA
MPVLNSKKREIDIKIVYYGPALCGKTTNLQTVFKKLSPHQRGEMVSLATKDDRTLFFDFLPIELGNVKGYKTRFHVYTVPGQVYYGLTRRAVLTNFDGVIFIADSQTGKMEDNIESFNDLEENLRFYKKDIYSIPFVLQYNKRDLPNIIPIEELNATLNKLQSPYFEACAINGPGVMETLTACCKQVLRQLNEASTKQDAPVIKLFKEPEPSIPLEPSIRPSGTFKEETDIHHGKLPSGFPEPSIIKPSFQYCAPPEAVHCEKAEKLEAPEASKYRESVYRDCLAERHSAGESQAQDLSTAYDTSEGFAEPCIEEDSDGCVPLEPLSPPSAPLPEGTAAMQGPVIRITSVTAEPLTAELPVNGAVDEALASPEGAAVVAELSEIPFCPVARISIENIEEDIDTEDEHEAFSEEDQPQTVTLAPQDTDDLSAYYSAAAKEDKILPEQPVEVPVQAGIEGAANFTIVACGQPHKETATAVKIPLIFKIEELNKECLVNLIINFNDFTMREPR